MGTAAPVIEAEMADWVSLGGVNLGIVGNADHSYGFHVAADELPASDYSRTMDPVGAYGPYVDWDFACAGDFSHENNETLRAMHRQVLSRLMNGEMPMICEFIGKPWADQPVYYWARWNGIETLQYYTGSGHDKWSHISWYRSMVNQRAYLWKGDSLSPEEMDQLANLTAEKVLTKIYRDADWTNPNNFTLGYMVFAINSWLSDPPLRDSLAKIQADVDKLLAGGVPTPGGVAPHKHDPGEVMTG
jgi:hypothetical protein